jgi:hypothetical protein
MKFVSAATVGLMAIILLLTTAALAAETAKKKPAKGRQPARLSATQKKLLDTRQNLIEKKIASRDSLKHWLETSEEKLDSQSEEYELSKIMYSWDLIPKPKLDQSERELVNTRLEIEHVRQWIAEDELALSLAKAEAQRNGLRGLLLEGHRESTILIRYSGFVDWSLAETGKIAKFFLRQFGRALPVSAMGQSATHERMGLDHRDAMDVAVPPDSEEGRWLMAYLRKAGIPFIAFRSKLRGWATGAHIHIGKPSLRIEQVKRSSAQESPAEKDPDPG